MTGYEPSTALPRVLLDRGDMKAAITAHDFGTVFLLARSQAGITYSQIAAACDIKPERVGLLARGQGSVTTFEKITRIADALRIPGRLLGLAPRAWEESGHGTDGDGGDLRRREFFKASAGTGWPRACPT